METTSTTAPRSRPSSPRQASRPSRSRSPPRAPSTSSDSSQNSSATPSPSAQAPSSPSRPSKQVYDRGAQFVLSPNLKDEVVTTTLKKGLISFPGAYTPSEIIHATELGAHAVKVFPASILGPKFIRAVLAPCPDLKLIPTGGVGLEDIPLYLKAGAWAIAAASEMMSKPPATHEEMKQLSTRASAFAAAARGADVA